MKTMRPCRACHCPECKPTLSFGYAGGLLLLCATLVIPVSAKAVGTFGISRSGTNIVIEWSDPGATLQSTTNLDGPWTAVFNASSPYVAPPTGKVTFYRLLGPQDESLYGAPEYTAEIGNPVSSCGCSSPENPNTTAILGSAQDNAGGSVYLETGELVQGSVDLRIPGVGFDWSFERHYRSGITYNGPLGRGWDFGQNRRLVVQGDEDVKRVGGDGRTDFYLLLTNGGYESPSGFYTRLTREPDGSFVERDRHGMQTFFSAPDSFGVARMTQITDRNNNTMRFSYNSGGQLTNVTDTLGRFITYQYNASGRLTNVEDFIGRTISFGYNGVGDLTSVTGPAVVGTPTGNDFPNGKTTLYTYDANHRLLTVTAPNEAAIGGPPRMGAQYDPVSGRLASLRLGGTNVTGIPAGGTLGYGYANLAQALPGDVSTAVFQTTVTNRNGNITRYQFNQLGNILSMIQFTRGIRAGDPPAYTNTFAFNADGETIAHTNPALNSVQFTLDSSNPDRFQQGNLLQTSRLPGPRGGDQASIVVSSTYETNFNFVATNIDARGNPTTYTYDAHGNCIHMTHRIQSIIEDFTYNGSGQLTSHLLPDNGSGWRRLDTNVYYTTGPQRGYLRDRIVDAAGFNITNHFDLDAVGNVTNVLDGLGNNTIYLFTSLNQVVRMLSRAVSTPHGLVRYQTDTFYDADNNVTNIVVQNIDDSGLVVVGLPNVSTATAYDILNNIVRRVQTQDATHNVTTTNAYDADQNLVLAAAGEAVNGDQPNNVVQTLYDERDLAYQQVRAPDDPGHSTTQYNYDGNRNLIITIQGLEDTLSPRVTTMGFDGFDRRNSVLDAMGNVTTNHFDPNGNVTNTTVLGELLDVPGSAGNTNLASTRSVFDAMDRRVTNDAAFFDTLTHTNIGSGHAIMVTVYSDNSQILTNFDANTNATATSFDTANRVSVVTDAKGNTKTMSYDANNNVTGNVEVDLSDSGQPPQTFTTVFSYDNVDRLIETVNSIGDTEFETYDSRNNRLSHVNENGNLETFAYDGLKRALSASRYLLDLSNSVLVTNIVLQQQSWDADSRLTSRTDDNNNTTRYFYDSLNRMAGMVYADLTSSTNIYDVHNNRVSSTDENGTVVSSVYDLLNRLGANNVTPAPGIVGPLAESYEYDGMSRVVQATNSNSKVTRRYDSLSHLTQETQQALPGGAPGTLTSAYDGVGNQLICIYPEGMRINNSFDALNRKLSISEGTFVLASNQYIGKWRLEHRAFANGINLYVSYDGLRRISEMEYTNPAAGTVVDDHTFTYDGDGNKQTATAANENYLYEYDGLDRLTNSFNLLAFQSTSYLLDGANNRTQVIGGTSGGTYTRNAGADLEMNQYSLTPFGTNHYDRNGNLTNASGSILSYDYRNQLAAFEYSSAGPTNTFKYDCFGRRVQETLSNSTESFYYDGSAVIQDNLAGSTNTYIRGSGIISMFLGTNLYFPLCNDLGSTLKATDIEGNVAESYTYDVFGLTSFFNAGNSPISASTIGNPYLFRGERYDLATPFGYTGARYVDYKVGEFTTRNTGAFASGGYLGGGGLAAGPMCHAFIYKCGGEIIYCSNNNGPSSSCTYLGDGTFPCDKVVSCSIARGGAPSGFDVNLDNARTFLQNNPLSVATTDALDLALPYAAAQLSSTASGPPCSRGGSGGMPYGPDTFIPYTPPPRVLTGGGSIAGWGCEGICALFQCTPTRPCANIWDPGVGPGQYTVGNKCAGEGDKCGYGCHCRTSKAAGALGPSCHCE